MKRTAFPLLTGLTLAAAAIAAHVWPHLPMAQGASAHGASIAVGEKVPDFSVTDLSGKPRKLSDLQKSTPSGAVTLTFWCSFCHSCRHMEARLQELARSQQKKAAVVAVDASAGETAERVRAFAKEKSLTLPILMDPEGNTADLFGVGVTTTTVVIDRERVLRYRGQFSGRDRAFAEDALKAVLAGGEVLRNDPAPVAPVRSFPLSEAGRPGEIRLPKCPFSVV